MWFFLGLGAIFAFLTAVILPWINRSRIQDLVNEIYKLKIQLNAYNLTIEKKESKNPSTSRLPYTSDELVTQSRSIAVNNKVEDNPEKKNKLEKPISRKMNNSFELQFGKLLPVWIGAIALALAGFYMVKYSLEEGLLSPSVRIALGIMFGALMAYMADFIRNKPKISNGKKISQALSGAGIADLYICVFAATNLYDILPSFIGFVGMALITIFAVFLSLRHGIAIALIGLLGGMITPALINSTSPSAPMLFMYLYFVIGGLIWVIRKRNWWIIAFPTIIAAFLWVLVWVYGGYYSPIDTIWLGMFLIAISGTVVISSRNMLISNNYKNKINPISVLNYIVLAGAIFITALISSYSDFGVFEWGLFALLSFASIGLAYFDQQNYGFLPLLAMIVIAVMLDMWSAYDQLTFAIVISAFAMIYIISGSIIQYSCYKPFKWSILTCVTAIVYYCLGYYKLSNAVFLTSIPHIWSILALLFSIYSLHVLQKVRIEMPQEHAQKQHIMATYALTIAAFLSLAFAIEIPQDFLSIALSAEILAIAWIKTKIDIKALKFIAIILFSVVALLFIPQILLAIQLAAYSLIEVKISLQKLPYINSPTMQLGVPAICFGISSYFFRFDKDGRFVKYLEVSSIILISIMGYYFIREFFYYNTNKLFIKPSFTERGVITNIIFLFGILCLWIGRKYKREAVSYIGLILSLSSIFRIIYFDYFKYNPLWSAEEVGSVPVFNALLITYGLPVLFTWKFTQELVCIKRFKLVNYSNYFILITLFLLVSLNIRQVFQGSFLNGKVISIAEIYTYSII
jgi:hypothetical protein